MKDRKTKNKEMGEKRKKERKEGRKKVRPKNF